MNACGRQAMGRARPDRPQAPGPWRPAPFAKYQVVLAVVARSEAEYLAELRGRGARRSRFPLPMTRPTRRYPADEGGGPLFDSPLVMMVSGTPFREGWH